MRSPIEIEWLQKAGSGTLGMPLGAATITLALIRALYVPTTLTISFPTTLPKHMILRISFDYLPEWIKESPISFMTVVLPHGLATTSGENTAE
jgi:hypothetical protein